VPRRSAGILLFRRASGLEVLLGHLGGPLWAKKDVGGWSAPKGLLEPGEDAEAAARREFAEELGLPVPLGPLLPLGDARQPSGKVVTLWALEGDLNPADVRPGTFSMEWPPRSGRMQSFPELDRVAWFDADSARERIASGQRVFLERLAAALEQSASGTVSDGW
jgi:predicted NUDIX family NTP pyrophosphohydrolase